ncbi:exodeoxyribonuclease V subunit gamma [Persicirhabdus sediminis]|uniref:Exodeoxyribonuclease V subunit gamma n=1 Tax=Persicirhabdus sediminis TaxID=454144 RepID=A0A8J7MBJ1_9BACT|nr:exodeoxyribonuclease V subunit gamma [Persicirhabdus sediminis]MBK1790013.1 exodeoxyribonuclease V subunit gamma [Persicirhabdus sediminis]
MANAHFYLHHHPRQESLADLLIDKLGQEGKKNPFARSTVLIQNRGMATWLRQRIAAKHGICMQLDFPLPDKFLRETLSHIPELSSTADLLEGDRLLWLIYRALPDLLDKAEFAPLAHYLEDKSDLKRYQLSDRIARLFDKYLIYRPFWIQAWENGESVATDDKTSETWQRLLWQHLRQLQPDSQHWVQALIQLSENSTTALAACKDHLPPAIHVFGMSNLAPSYINFLYLLSEVVEVNIYWLNPVDGYTGESQSKRQWMMEKEIGSELQDDWLFDLQNPLLASYGRMGREFLYSLHSGEKAEYELQQVDFNPSHPVPYEPQSLLQRLQDQIYQNIYDEDQLAVAADDDSIDIRSCHTPLREVETLHTYLLDQFEKHPELDASEILVLCPQIEKYSPAIEAVFGSYDYSNPCFLPYHISDRSAPAVEPCIQAVIQLLQLQNSRFTSRDALSLLAVPSLAENFNIKEDGLKEIQQWIENVGIRWGFDRQHVQMIAQQKISADWSWQAGLERLMLGYAMPENSLSDPDAELLWHDTLPYDQVEGQSAELLGSLCDFVQLMHKIWQAQQEKRTVAEWIEIAHSWITDAFRADADTQQRLIPVNQALDKLAEASQAAQIDENIEAATFAQYISDHLANESPEGGFLNGSVTFCELKPMRAIPSKIVCMIGINHDSYPRRPGELQFDLTIKNRRPCDRSSRDDDSYLFLEAILSARNSLYISYTGASIKDGKERPPSTLLQSFIDQFPTADQLCTREALHGFDPLYFSSAANRRQQYDASLLAASRELLSQQPDQSSRPKIPRIPDDEQTVREIGIHELVSAFDDSSRHFIRHGLQAYLAYQSPPVSEHEPYAMDGLSSYQIKDRVLQDGLFSSQQIRAHHQLSHIPADILGDVAMEKINRSYAPLIDQVIPSSPYELDLTIQHIRITGQIQLANDGELAVTCRPAKVKAKDWMKLWLHTLVASAATKKAHGGSHQFDSKKGQLEVLNFDYVQPKEAEEILTQWLNIYEKMNHQPVPHFPNSCYEYASALYAPKGEPDNKEAALRAALTTGWKSGSHSYGDDSKDSHFIIYGTEPPLNDEFESLTELLWKPMFDHLMQD